MCRWLWSGGQDTLGSLSWCPDLFPAPMPRSHRCAAAGPASGVTSCTVQAEGTEWRSPRRLVPGPGGADSSEGQRRHTGTSNPPAALASPVLPMGYLETAEVWHKFPEIKLCRVISRLWLLFKLRTHESKADIVSLSEHGHKTEEEATPPSPLPFRISLATVLPWSIATHFPHWQALNSG